MSEQKNDECTTSNNNTMSNEIELKPIVNSVGEKENGTSCVFQQALTVMLAALALAQYVYGITDHSTLMKMQFSASVLAFVGSIETLYSKKARRNSSDMQGVFLLYRTAGTVFYIACMFLNLTHCFEEISNIKGDVHNESLPISLEQVEDAGHSHNHGVSDWTLYISAADFALKLLFTLTFNALTINYILSFIALVCPAIVTLMVYAYKYVESHWFFDWLNHHLEPVMSIVLTVMCIGIALFSLHRKKQYLLVEGPKEFSIDKISDSVKSKNESLEKIDHVHASCEWPHGFTVSLKAYIKVEKTNKNWVSEAATNFSQLKSLLHAEIKAEGAKEVIVEPVFVDRNENADYMDPICIDKSCHNEDVGCCTNRSTSPKV